MKYLVGYTDQFLSPISGMPRCNLPLDYVFLGDRDGNPLQSPVIIDIKLDLISLRKEIDSIVVPDLNSTFILQTPNLNLPNSQALNQLSPGIMKQSNGIVSTAQAGIDYLGTTLSEGKLFKGDSNNKVSETQTIDLENLPDLGVAIIEGLELPAGKIWRGTISGRPEESNELSVIEADVLAINTRFALTHFVQNSRTLSSPLMPASQYLSDLPGGMAKIQPVTGLFEIAIPGTDYVRGPNPPLSVTDSIATWIDATGTQIKSTNVTVNNNNDVAGINQLRGQSLRGLNEVLSPIAVYSGNWVAANMEYRWGDYYAQENPIHISLAKPAGLANNLNWTMPSTQGNAGQVLTNLDGTQWGWGDMAPNQATYIVQSPDDNLPNAQALDRLNDGVMLNVGGVVATDSTFVQSSTNFSVIGNIAVWSDVIGRHIGDGGISIPQIQEYAAAAEASAAASAASALSSSNSAAAAAGSAAQASGSAIAAKGSAGAAEASAAEASGAASEASGAAAEATGAAVEATGAAAAASGSAAAAAGSAAEATAAAAEATAAAAEATGAAAAASGSAAAAAASAAASEASAAASAASAGESAASAAAALVSQNASAASAAAALASEGAAAASAASAAGSATAAAASAAAADTSAIGAAASAVAAAGSALSAQTYYNDLLATGLNALPNHGDVNLQGYRIINLHDPIDETDAANKRYVDEATSGAIGALTINGFVTGGPPISNVITTSRGESCVLNNIPASANVSFNNYSITNLESIPLNLFEDSGDRAVNLDFLIRLLNDEVI